MDNFGLELGITCKITLWCLSRSRALQANKLYEEWIKM